MPNASNWIHTHTHASIAYVCRESRIGVQWKGLMCVQKRKVCQMNFISAPWWHSLKRAELHEVHLWQTACDSMQRSIWCAHNLLIELERWREELGSSSEVSCVFNSLSEFQLTVENIQSLKIWCSNFQSQVFTLMKFPPYNCSCTLYFSVRQLFEKLVEKSTEQIWFEMLI